MLGDRAKLGLAFLVSFGSRNRLLLPPPKLFVSPPPPGQGLCGCWSVNLGHIFPLWLCQRVLHVTALASGQPGGCTEQSDAPPRSSLCWFVPRASAEFLGVPTVPFSLQWGGENEAVSLPPKTNLAFCSWAHDTIGVRALQTAASSGLSNSPVK